VQEAFGVVIFAVVAIASSGVDSTRAVAVSGVFSNTTLKAKGTIKVAGANVYSRGACDSGNITVDTGYTVNCNYGSAANAIGDDPNFDPPITAPPAAAVLPATCTGSTTSVTLSPGTYTSAAALNAMERHRDPSTVEFRALEYLRGLFADTGLPEPSQRFYGVPAERERLVAMAFPAGDDRAGLRAMIDAAVEGDALGVGGRRDGDTVRFEYPAVVLVAAKT